MTATMVTIEDDNEPKEISRQTFFNDAMDAITEIIWPIFRRAQLCDQDILVVKIDFGETGVYQIDAMTVQFPAKFSCGTAQR
jgi:superfamily I DNA and RNA helicase